MKATVTINDKEFGLQDLTIVKSSFLKEVRAPALGLSSDILHQDSWFCLQKVVAEDPLLNEDDNYERQMKSREMVWVFCPEYTDDEEGWAWEKRLFNHWDNLLNDTDEGIKYEIQLDPQDPEEVEECLTSETLQENWRKIIIVRPLGGDAILVNPVELQD